MRKDDEQTPRTRPPHVEGVEDTIGPGISEPEKATGLQTSQDHVDRVESSGGYRAPSVDDTGIAQQSIFDGAGNETIVVTTTDADGRRIPPTAACRLSQLITS